MLALFLSRWYSMAREARADASLEGKLRAMNRLYRLRVADFLH